MQKANVIKSSEFFMDEGDVLNMLFLDEQGTPVTVTLNSVSTDGTDNRELPPDAPVALDASDITDTSFSANWNLMENTLGFYLDVATDLAFTSFVAGYNDLDVGLVDTYPVVGLDDATLYYYRLRGYNDYGTGESSNVITTLSDTELVVDADGNVYTYVTIGTQQWLVENLKTTKYADGTPIPNLTVNGDWLAEDGTGGHDGAYCWYNNDIANKADYGALYNGYAAENARGLTPMGWRIPSQVDWNDLANELGGASVAGGKLKELGIGHWIAPNTGATNESGFTGLPAGIRGDTSGFFIGLFNYTHLWLTPIGNLGILTYDSSAAGAYGDYKENGYSVRCMRDV